MTKGDGFLAVLLTAAVLVVPVYAEQQSEQTAELVEPVVMAEPVPVVQVWDASRSQWVPLAEAGKRASYEQVPVYAPAIPGGAAVLDSRLQAVRSHWEYVLWLRDKGLL